jgi:hypothetical protein
MGSVQSLKLNETHAALLMEGRVLVHPIEVRKHAKILGIISCLFYDLHLIPG